MSRERVKIFLVTDSDIENRLVVAKEAGRGEMDWEFGMSGCKLLDIGWIINKV